MDSAAGRDSTASVRLEEDTSICREGVLGCTEPSPSRTTAKNVVQTVLAACLAPINSLAKQTLICKYM